MREIVSINNLIKVKEGEVLKTVAIAGRKGDTITFLSYLLEISRMENLVNCQFVSQKDKLIWDGVKTPPAPEQYIHGAAFREEVLDNTEMGHVSPTVPYAILEQNIFLLMA